MREFWDGRYADEAYAYGDAPNRFLAEVLAGRPPGRILLPADGEGRNGVYAASLGWEVVCFDISPEGRRKALALSARRGVSIDYRIASMADVAFEASSFDAVALVYAHFPAAVRRDWHRRILGWLRPGAIVVLEAFSQAHPSYQAADPGVGGPSDAALLYSAEEVAQDFSDCRPLLSVATEVVLDEGLYHVGRGHVVRYLGQRDGEPGRLTP